MFERELFDYKDCITESVRGSQRMSAREFFQLVFVHYPKPAAWMLLLRDKMVQPLGLQTGNRFEQMILSETENQIVLGQTDKHLDFYVLLDCFSPLGSWQDVRLSTCVKYHNFLGRLYFWGIRPAHIVLVRYLVKRAVKLWEKEHASF